MRKLIISSLAVLLAVSVYADDADKEKEVATDESVVSSDEASLLFKDFGCGSCGGKTKK